MANVFEGLHGKKYLHRKNRNVFGIVGCAIENVIEFQYLKFSCDVLFSSWKRFKRARTENRAMDMHTAF